MKRTQTDHNYLKKRKELSQKTGKRELWNVIDHWPLYVGIGNLARMLAIEQLFRQSLKVPGHLAEFGSWRGANLMLLAKMLKILDPNSSKKVHCFESFEGLKTFVPKDGKQTKKTRGSYQGCLKELEEMIKLYQLQDSIEIHKGDIAQTLPATLTNKALSFSFVYCDTDLYAPSKIILESLHPRISKGGLVVMDEWNFGEWPGETIAVREFMEKHGAEYEMLHVPATKQPSLILKKIC